FSLGMIWSPYTNQIKPGDVVLLQAEAPRNKWPLSKVLSVKTGRDGLVRCCTLKLPSVAQSNGAQNARFRNKNIEVFFLTVSYVFQSVEFEFKVCCLVRSRLHMEKWKKPENFCTFFGFLR